MNKFLVGAIGCLATVYLINPTAGIIELIPDNIPVFGNLDDGAACYILYSCIEYFRGRKIGMFRGKE